MKCIDADLVRRVIESPRSKEQMINIIKGLPIVDVRKNVKGEWIIGEFYNEPCTCSVCMHKFQHKAYFLYSYCPNCGAEMRPRTEKIYVPKEDFEVEE